MPDLVATLVLTSGGGLLPPPVPFGDEVVLRAAFVDADTGQGAVVTGVILRLSLPDGATATIHQDELTAGATGVFTYALPMDQRGRWFARVSCFSPVAASSSQLVVTVLPGSGSPVPVPLHPTQDLLDAADQAAASASAAAAAATLAESISTAAGTEAGSAAGAAAAAPYATAAAESAAAAATVAVSAADAEAAAALARDQAQAAAANGRLRYATLTALQANLTPGADAVAEVDGDDANNGTYLKSGASGTGSWSRINTATVPALDTRLAPVETLVTPEIEAVANSTAGGLPAGVVEVDADERILRETTPEGYRYYAPVTIDSLRTDNVTLGGQEIVYLDPVEYERSGYAEVLVDADFRILGTVEPPATLPVTVSAPSYAVYEATGSDARTQVFSEARGTGQRIQLSSLGSANTGPVLLPDGNVTWVSDRADGPPGGRFWSPPGVAAEAPFLPYPSIVCWGDSLTADGYPATLGTLLGRAAYNGGVSGQTSAEVAARQGGVPSLLTVTGNTIPASGGVLVTAQMAALVTSGGPSGGVAGTLAGVAGTLTRDSDTGAVIFTRAAPGSEVACAPATPFLPELAGRDGWTTIFWYGRNNRYETWRILSDLRASVAFLKSYAKRFVIVSLTNSASEVLGTPAHQEVITARDLMQAEWPDNFVDLRGWLVSQYDAGVPQDVIDHANDVMPSSLRRDAIHLNSTGYGLAAQHLADFITAKGW